MEIPLSDGCHCTQNNDHTQSLFPIKSELYWHAVKVCSGLKGHGIHSANRMKAAGFQYTGVGDTVQCDICGLKVSEWIPEMDPFSIHLERNANCSFVRSVQSKNKWISNDEENPAKRQNKVVELETLKQVRRRTFSHWPQETALMKEQMISAGFFQCNVGDRVICLYCNIICQQWEGNMDDPIEVHKTLSPICPYVRSMLTQTEPSSISIVNEISTDTSDSQTAVLNDLNRFRFEQLVYTSPSHIDYTSIPSRQATFETWSNQLSPSIDDLVKAGFFYTGVRNIVRCFYCNGSLQNWSENDNPLIEHIRWFPHCAYAKQLSGNELYNKVQKAKNDDFVSDCDLLIACVILQKQIEHIDGNKDNIIVPSIKMKLIRDREQSDTLVRKQFVSPPLSPTSTNDSSNKANDTSAQASSVIEPMNTDTTNELSKVEEPTSETKLSANNPCVLCCKEEKRLACIPCGHLVACVSCSQTIRTCPICRREIEAFVRIYI
ncbi:unnamed protein product [Rotaria sp. Silwood2]|nr:unnamed protein product [Rotaria sp. Silwood2]CAF2909996.1 unnamed protein product [Rotaria sp. Silwood2]CAF3062743.1 unnamed protein product [Rotaria sp. Silwood2]CAF3281822.1 unnamed protein product [Rotaria sp. Silwood2]CAF4008289.1 unnamed protein product [Rotaria sp. Silwood2]